MLILSRKIGETVKIGDNVSITVVGLHGSQVKIGIEAPRDVTIHREEIYDMLRQQNEAACE